MSLFNLFGIPFKPSSNPMGSERSGQSSVSYGNYSSLPISDGAAPNDYGLKDFRSSLSSSVFKSSKFTQQNDMPSTSSVPPPAPPGLSQPESSQLSDSMNSIRNLWYPSFNPRQTPYSASKCNVQSFPRSDGRSLLTTGSPQASRLIRIKNLPTNAAFNPVAVPLWSGDSRESLFSPESILQLCNLVGQTFSGGTFIDNSTVVALYYDLRDAVRAFHCVSEKFTLQLENLTRKFDCSFTQSSQSSINEAEISIEYVPVVEFDSVLGNKICRLNLSDIELFKRPQLYIAIDEAFYNNTSVDILYRVLSSSFGGLRSFKHIPGQSSQLASNKMIFVCEFFDIRCALTCVESTTNNKSVINFPFRSSFFYDESFLNSPFNDCSALSSPHRSSDSSYTLISPNDSIDSKSFASVASSGSSITCTSEQGKSTRLFQRYTNPFISNKEELLKDCTLDLEVMADKTNNSTSLSSIQINTTSSSPVVTRASVSSNNIVDLDRIEKGLDTRTTLMLRNIPNKIDQQMLKEYVDVTNRNTYDFLYLRIDFANKCNVGYAFISFIKPEHIITFAKARAGTKWNRFNSEKICDMSYANIYVEKPLKVLTEPPTERRRGDTLRIYLFLY